MKMQSKARTAVPGDICVLAEPAQDEIIEIRQRQKSLQRLFGGRFHDRVHLTCQRFELSAKDSRLPQVMQCLRTRLATVQPFSVSAVSLLGFDSQFWQTRLLRWRIEVTEEVQYLCRRIEEGLEAMDIEPHFRSFSPTLVTALEDIARIDLDQALKGMIFPRYLFTVRQMVISRILGRGEFEILEIIQLSGA